MDIFVGSIPFKWKEKDLIEVFSEFGTVESVKIIINKATRQNKGFGFVTMPNEREALRAIAQLHEKEFLERKIVVTIANPDKKSSTLQRVSKKVKSQENAPAPWFRKR